MPTSKIVPVYKITRPNQITHGGYRWPISAWRTFPGIGPLCGPGWAHFYLSPQLALLLNPIHAAYDPLILWAGEGVIGKCDHQIKVGCSRARLVHKIPVPLIALEQRVTFAIWCALAVYQNAEFVDWAERWLSGYDRTQAAAWAVKAGAGEAAAAAALWAAEAAAAAAWEAEEATAAVVRAAAKATVRAAAKAAVWAVHFHSLDLVTMAAAALLPWEPAHAEIKEN